MAEGECGGCHGWGRCSLTVLRGGGGEERVFVEARVGPFRDALLSVGVPEERQLVELRRPAALVEVVPVEVGDERCGGVAGEGGHDGKRCARAIRSAGSELCSVRFVQREGEAPQHELTARVCSHPVHVLHPLEVKDGRMSVSIPYQWCTSTRIMQCGVSYRMQPRVSTTEPEVLEGSVGVAGIVAVCGCVILPAPSPTSSIDSLPLPTHTSPPLVRVGRIVRVALCALFRMKNDE